MGENGNLLSEDRKREERKFQIKRRKVLFLIGTVFSVVALILIVSVVHEEYNKQKYTVFECDDKDSDCLKLLCPQGWNFDKDRNMCFLLQDYECCPEGFYLCGESVYTRCYNTSDVALMETIDC